jgi:hypothetical protein
LFAFVFFFVPVLALAQIDYTLLAPLEEGQTTYRIGGANSLSDYLTTIYKTGIGIAGILAVLMLVWGGFKYATSEAFLEKGEGKEIIWNVAMGGAIVLGSWLLLFTINPRLLDIGLSLSSLNPVKKQRIPTAAEHYGEFLDDALERTKRISSKAQDIKVQADAVEKKVNELERKLREGDFTPEEIANFSALEEELNELRPKLQELRTAETEVRKYENTSEALRQASGQIQECLRGLGRCSTTGVTLAPNSPMRSALLGPLGSLLTRITYDEKASKDTVANNATALQIVEAARSETNQNKATLVKNGFTEQAAALENQMARVEIASRTAMYTTNGNENELRDLEQSVGNSVYELRSLGKNAEATALEDYMTQAVTSARTSRLPKNNPGGQVNPGNIRGRAGVL